MTRPSKICLVLLNTILAGCAIQPSANGADGVVSGSPEDDGPVSSSEARLLARVDLADGRSVAFLEAEPA